MARPRLAVERAECPQGHEDGVVSLHGRRRRADARYEKTRWRCVRTVAPKVFSRHYWTAPRRTPTHEHPDGTTCGTCEHEVRRGEGPTIVPAFSFAVAEAARSLVLVGEGKSLREASQKLRYESGKFSADVRGNRWASRQNALASDYLDHFGPTVVRAMTPPSWPRILVLDSQPLGIRIRNATNPGYDASREGGAVLVAAGRDRHQARTRSWLTTLAGDETGESWWEFLHQLDADPPPFWVVADGSTAIRNAVEELWPKAIFYPCEEHLRRRAKTHAESDGVLRDPGMEDAIAHCFYGVEAWDELGDRIKAGGPSLLLNWWWRTDPDARRMVELKHRYGDYPNGNGPAEWVATSIRARIEARIKVFRNADRLATVIALMGIDLAEQASVTAYGRILREQLAGQGWDPDLDWEGPHDYYGEAPSIDELLMAAWDRADAAAPGVMQSAVSNSVFRKADAINVLNLATGVPPLTPTIKPGRHVASQSVAGKFLRDYPHLMGEWDTELNDPVPDIGAVQAGAGIRPHWICRRCGHRWRAWMTDRTSHLTQCRSCNRQWADEKTSIAAVHPELVEEWDPDLNEKRSPDRIKATSARPAFWLCLTEPIKHDSYKMSPLARGNWIERGKPGCPECRQRLSKAALRAQRVKGKRA
jgi:Probable Zinc-ribbon domain